MLVLVYPAVVKKKRDISGGVWGEYHAGMGGVGE